MRKKIRINLLKLIEKIFHTPQIFKQTGPEISSFIAYFLCTTVIILTASLSRGISTDAAV